MVLEKVDLVMWSRYGANAGVLEKINKVVPSDWVNQKFVVIDSLEDLPLGALHDFIVHGWSVVMNKGKGISDAANTALKFVELEFFVSFEDDLLLSEDWWDSIPQAFKNPKVAASSGFRLPNKPSYLVKLQEYSLEKYREQSSKPMFLYGKNLDNTMYRTSAIRSIGGFPVLRVGPGVDNILAKRLHEAGFIWQVDFDVRSIHLRRGFWHEVRQYWWYGKCYRELKKHLGDRGDSVLSIFLRTLFSPIRATIMAWKQKSPLIVFAYPIIRLAIFLGVCHSFFWKAA